MEALLDPAQLADLLATTLRLAVPVIFAALGGLLSERSGIYNVALEGMMLNGAFGAAAGAFWGGSALTGLLLGLLVGALTGLLLAALSVSLKVNQIVAGIAINLLAGGLTAFLARQVFGMGATTQALPGFEPFPIPLLADLPVIGPVLFQQDILVYAMYLVVPLAHLFLFHTPQGLEVRAIGESPSAADTAGVPVYRVRYLCVIASGALAALGGAYLVLAQVHLFTEHMSAGKGFIALAALILGRWSPLATLAACLLFGFCDALQLRLQFANPQVPYQIFVILPYVASILALVLLHGRVRPPAAVGLAYDRESR
jgi:simple sugar transport system permease protein